MSNDEYRAEQAERRQHGLKARHEQRLENATYTAAEVKVLTEKAQQETTDKFARAISEAVDLCWKATPYGDTEDGDVAAYIVPKGVVHRLVGALQGAGIPASLRAFDEPPKCACPTTAVLGHRNDCPVYGESWHKVRGAEEPT